MIVEAYMHAKQVKLPLGIGSAQLLPEAGRATINQRQKKGFDLIPANLSHSKVMQHPAGSGVICG